MVCLSCTASDRGTRLKKEERLNLKDSYPFQIRPFGLKESTGAPGLLFRD